MLGKFERKEVAPEDWRRFRLVRGTYGQRRTTSRRRGSIPQANLTGVQPRGLAGVVSRYARRATTTC